MHVLLIDDDEDERRLAAVVLAHSLPEATVVEVGNAASYAERLYGETFDAAIAPVSTAWGDGAALLAGLRRRQPHCATILLGELPAEMLHGVLASGSVDAVLARSSRGLARLAATVRELAGGDPGRAPGSLPPTDTEPTPNAGAEDSRTLMAALCHDLQDPLQVILHTARRATPGDETAPTPREMQRIIGNAERMQSMLDALAQGDNLSARAPRIEAVDLEALVDEVVRDLEGRNAVLGAAIERAALPVVEGDRDQLRRLFDNLIGNALKFRSAAPPRVAVQAIERPSEWLLSVADNGIGIAPEDAERVFSMFVRLHGPRDFPGSGVGLAICRRIARAHGGEIWVQPTPGGGATFVVALPKPQTRAAEAPRQ